MLRGLWVMVRGGGGEDGRGLWVMVRGGGGEAGRGLWVMVRGGGGEDGGERTGRGPQSSQSVPYAQNEYLEPGPPSSQSVSDEWKHVFKQVIPGGVAGGGGGAGGAGGGGESTGRGPQSSQSVPYAQIAYLEPGPPSSQSVSDEWKHVFKQMIPGVGVGEGGGGGFGECGGGFGGGGGVRGLPTPGTVDEHPVPGTVEQYEPQS